RPGVARARSGRIGDSRSAFWIRLDDDFERASKHASLNVFESERPDAQIPALCGHKRGRKSITVWRSAAAYKINCPPEKAGKATLSAVRLRRDQPARKFLFEIARKI